MKVKWTQDKPTTDGVYWWKKREGDKPVVVEIETDQVETYDGGVEYGNRYVYWIGDDEDALLENVGGFWSERLTAEDA